MAERRSEEPSVAPRRSLAGPGGSDAGQTRREGPSGKAGSAGTSGATSTSGSTDKSAKTTGKGERRDPRLDDTVASPPVRDDDTDAPRQRSSGSERFAAAVSSVRDKSAGRPRGASSGSRTPRKVRKAHLRVAHVDPWSVMKTAFLLSIAIGIVLVVAVAVIWSVLGATGVWDSVNRAVTDVVGGEASDSFNVENYLGMSRVLGFTLIVAVVDVVLMTVIATLGAFLYNLAAVLLGGVEVTLAEDERPAPAGQSNTR